MGENAMVSDPIPRLLEWDEPVVSTKKERQKQKQQFAKQAAIVRCQSALEQRKIKNKKPKGWSKMPSLKETYPSFSPICVGNIIWVSTRHNVGENGMVSFDCGSRKFCTPIPYPSSSSFEFHSVCGSETDGIALVDGQNGYI